MGQGYAKLDKANQGEGEDLAEEDALKALNRIFSSLKDDLTKTNALKELAEAVRGTCGCGVVCTASQRGCVLRSRRSLGRNSSGTYSTTRSWSVSKHDRS